MIVLKHKIYALHDEHSPDFYLPDDRVSLGETPEQAVMREVQKVLGIAPKIVCPVGLNQASCTDDVDSPRYHELGICFWMNVSETDLPEDDDTFIAHPW